MEPTTISTPNFILSGVTPQLIHHLFNTKSREEIISYFGADENGYEHLKSQHERGMETFRLSHYYFLILDKENQQPIGECGFHTWNATHRRAELFYGLKSDEYKRKGFMTEVLPYVLEFGFSRLNLHRIAALTADWNIASVKLIEKNGFTKEGVMREDYCVDGNQENSICYSLLKWEWENQC